MFKVIKAQGQGLLNDLGRAGFQSQGVPIGGVLDDFSFFVGNLALGNPPNAVCLELMGTFEFLSMCATHVFMASRNGSMSLNRQRCKAGSVVRVQEGDVLRVEPSTFCTWSVLCVQGGFQADEVLNSGSTCQVAGFGGHRGRALLAGDVLGLNEHTGPHLPSGLQMALPVAARDPDAAVSLACLPGPEAFHLDEGGLALFCSRTYSILAQSSRMAYRLDADQALPSKHMPLMRSHAVHAGVVQLPPQGQPIVLLSEAQATGGYPRIAAVLGVELWKLGQLAPGRTVQFRLVSWGEAELLNLQHARERDGYRKTIENHFNQC